MPELPEIARLASQIHENLSGKTIAAVDVIQPKSLNIPAEDFKQAVTGATIQGASYRGKWVQIDLDHGWLLLNLGMGGETLLVTPASLPAKRRVVIGFTDGSCLSINFWWFGYMHYVAPGELHQHKMTARLGPNALEVNAETLEVLLHSSQGVLKTFLLDQSKIAGIGNAYIHDIQFQARLHPLRRIESLQPEEMLALHAAIRGGLKPSLDKGGAWYEVDLFGKPGGFTNEDILIGYRQGQPCPWCGSAIEKIRTGSTTSYICPACQPISRQVTG